MTKQADTSIKAGDTVTFDTPDDAYGSYHMTVGKSYKVKSTHMSGYSKMVEIESDDRGRTATWYGRRFTKVDPKFKSGDIVECVNDTLGPQKVGSLYQVAAVYNDTEISFQESLYGRFTAARFKLAYRPTALVPAPEAVAALPSKWMVCALDSKGSIKPSSSPRLMAHERQAIAVSKSMAEDHTGDTFAAVSFSIGATFRAEPVEVKTVKHEVRQVG